MIIEDDAPLYTEPRADAEAQLDALFGGGPDEEPDEDEPVAPGVLTGDPRTTSIDALNLSIRARRCMETLEIRTVGELIQRSEAELMASKNFGLTSLNEVRERLEEMGMGLRKR
jgi:DNA-directed RNA polymerase subunit alpha